MVLSHSFGLNVYVFVCSCICAQPFATFACICVCVYGENISNEMICLWMWGVRHMWRSEDFSIYIHILLSKFVHSIAASMQLYVFVYVFHISHSYKHTHILSYLLAEHEKSSRHIYQVWYKVVYCCCFILFFGLKNWKAYQHAWKSQSRNHTKQARIWETNSIQTLCMYDWSCCYRDDIWNLCITVMAIYWKHEHSGVFGNLRPNASIIY